MMTELYLLFFIVGLLLFAAIVAYSVYQKKQFTPPEKKNYIDPLFEQLQETRQETKKEASTVDPQVAIDSQAQAEEQVQEKQAPTLVAPSDTQEDAGKEVASAKTNEPVLDSADSVDNSPEVGQQSEQARQNTQAKTAIREGGELITELIARVKNTQPREQTELLGILRKHDFKFNRKVHLYGLNELTELWRDVEFELPSARFLELGLAIQLADRNGAMSKKELHDFQQMALEFSNTYDAPFEFSMDIDEAHLQAARLDELGQRYDSMAVLNIVPRSKAGFKLADIETCARDLLMATDSQGIFVKTRGSKNNQQVLYRLACTDGLGHFGVQSSAMAPVHDLVMYMNVPATENPQAVFKDMIREINELATWLDGKVVDRQGKAMTEKSYSVLSRQIEEIVVNMQREGLTPGDPVCRKLF